MLVLTRCECACCKKPRARRREEAMVTTVSDESSKAVFACTQMCVCVYASRGFVAFRKGLKVVLNGKFKRVPLVWERKCFYDDTTRESLTVLSLSLFRKRRFFFAFIKFEYYYEYLGTVGTEYLFHRVLRRLAESAYIISRRETRPRDWRARWIRRSSWKFRRIYFPLRSLLSILSIPRCRRLSLWTSRRVT